jgi:hypothetical protein
VNPGNYNKVCDSCDHTYESDELDDGRCPECAFQECLSNPLETADDACLIAEDFINEMEKQGFASGPLPAEYDTLSDYLKRWRAVYDQRRVNAKATGAR